MRQPLRYFPFTLSLSLPEHLNVTTRLARKIASSPVAGFRPFRSFLSFTQNLPNPDNQDILARLQSRFDDFK
jgi:hypothetical protein